MERVKNNSVVKYFREVREELRKVEWPTVKEVRKNSIAVVIVCALVALYFGLLDWALNAGLNALVSLTA